MKSQRRQRVRPPGRVRRSPKPKSPGILIRFFRFVLVLLALLCLGFFLYKIIFPKLVKQSDRVKYVVVTSHNATSGQTPAMFLIKFSPQEKGDVVRLLEGSTKVNVLGGYGEYELQAVYPLLALEKKDEQFIGAAFSHALGIVVDEVVSFPDLTTQNFSQKVAKDVVSQSLKAVPSWGQIKTYWQLHYVFSQKVLDDVNQLSLAVSSVPELVKDEPMITNTQAQNCQIAVINTTAKSGLANVVSKILEQSGGIVVRVTNEPTLQEHSQIIYSPEETNCQGVAHLAMGMFPQRPEVKTDVDITQRYRAHLVIMVGADLSESLQ